MRYAVRQIEASPKNEAATNWSVDPASLPKVKIGVNSGAVVPGIGQHATAVAQFLAGDNSPCASVCTDLFLTHSSYFKGVNCLGDGRVWTATEQYPTNPFPFLLPNDGDPGIRMVINCSFGDNVAKDFVTGQPVDFHPEQNTFNRLTDYLNKTGYLLIAALPDKGMLYDAGYIQDFPAYSPNVIAVGSADLGHEEPYGRKPDCVAYGYTSFTAPQVASLALRLLYEGDQIGITLTANQVKELIFLGCDKALTPYSQGNGAINIKKTLAIFTEKYVNKGPMADTTTPLPTTLPLTP